MSSNHFVKEGQEPSLIIAGHIQFNKVEPLLEWAPLVLVIDSAIDHVSLWGIKLDIIICASGMTNNIKEKFAYQVPFKIISYSLTEDPTAAALNYLISLKQQHVNVLSNTVAQYFEQAEKFINRLEIVLTDNMLKWSSITSGIYKKWFQAHTSLRIRQSDELTLEGRITKQGDFFLVEADGLVIIRSKGPFWLGEFL